MAGGARAWVKGGLPIGAVALAYALYIALRLAAHDYDPSYFVQAGDRLANRSAAPPNLHVLSNSLGYDGQAYYRLALHPLTVEVTAYGVTLDRPGYRQQRILYPAMVWVASLGRPALVPAMLIAINYLGLCLMAWIGVVYARLLRQPAALGILFPLWPGFLYTLGLDLTEIIAGTCLLGASCCSACAASACRR